MALIRKVKFGEALRRIFGLSAEPVGDVLLPAIQPSFDVLGMDTRFKAPLDGAIEYQIAPSDVMPLVLHGWAHYVGEVNHVPMQYVEVQAGRYFRYKLVATTGVSPGYGSHVDIELLSDSAAVRKLLCTILLSLAAGAARTNIYESPFMMCEEDVWCGGHWTCMDSASGTIRFSAEVLVLP